MTVQECSGTLALGGERARRFSAVCENMEGAAAAHVCLLYGVRFIELRGISNRVEDRRTEDWDLPLAAAKSQAACLELLARMAEMPAADVGERAVDERG